MRKDLIAFCFFLATLLGGCCHCNPDNAPPEMTTLNEYYADNEQGDLGTFMDWLGDAFFFLLFGWW